MHDIATAACEYVAPGGPGRSNAKRGYDVRSHSKPLRFVFCPEWIGLECECGERVILIGREEDWRSEVRTTFECECGKKLALDDNRVEYSAGSSTTTP
jgi:hypothetical protein